MYALFLKGNINIIILCLSFLPEQPVVERWVSWADVMTMAGLLVARRPRRSNDDGSRVRETVAHPGGSVGGVAEGAKTHSHHYVWTHSYMPKGRRSVGIYIIMVYRKSTIRVKWRFLLFYIFCSYIYGYIPHIPHIPHIYYTVWVLHYV